MTSTSVKWLEQMLSERISSGIHLSHYGDVWRLELTGHEGALTFPDWTERFSSGTSALPCTAWDARSEGYEVPTAPRLPAPGTEHLPAPLISQSADGYHIGYDIPGLAYWMLNRLEEIGRTDLDDHHRFPATASHAFAHGYLERPVVDEWLHVLGQVMQRQWPQARFKRREFQTIVSHDADVPSRIAFRPLPDVLRDAIRDLAKEGRPLQAWRRLKLRLRGMRELHPQDPHNTFAWLMDQSEARGLKSAFYFICGRTNVRRDAAYEPEHPAIRSLLRAIHKRGHEIGLHPSYETYRDPATLKAEADRLRRVCAEEGIRQEAFGGRMHYLRWEHPTTLAAWDAAGMAYDSTMGYADRPGFRAGTCHEYPGFDPVNDKPLAVRVRPLVAMESTVIAPRYLGLGEGRAAIDKFLDLKNACRKVGGDFTLLWHNSELLGAEARACYLAVLDG